jgi:putative (di)nucleoside polyphosphate hydrolase
LSDLPYRLNVGAALFNVTGQVFVGRRGDVPAGGQHVWQMPQGGIDAGEDPRQAVMRELAEETGTGNAEILAEHDEWLQYDVPADLVGRAFGGRYRGQRQRWFALGFLGQDSDIRLDAHLPAEFVEWKWVELAALPALAVPFKRHIYEAVITAFAGISAARRG